MLLSPNELHNSLSTLITTDTQLSVMIWGKPGIGKSSVVANIAKQNNLAFVDIRLTQLMPSDLRGIPVPDQGKTHWFPPSFLPTKGKGILFLDEINMAPPTMQGVAQQLILDRKIGDYNVPDGWFIWAAGNRAEDKAAVFKMPAPLANRFLHFDVAISLDDFKRYALLNNIDSKIIGFLNFRPALLHKPNDNDPRWPSPRSWEMASQLLKIGLNTSSAIGNGCAIELEAFIELSYNMPDLNAIMQGTSIDDFPTTPSISYALISALAIKIKVPSDAVNSFKWLLKTANPEWIQVFINDLFLLLNANGQFAQFATAFIKDPTAKKYLQDYAKLTKAINDVL
ncbi:AAA family ATPase [Algibacillus agarilyticus]|uniref:AAA family ATPase n=1 Tax=Algibacillus agarilyticus TaxID=2234133 RepID=UPI000DCFAA19|nr:MoxR family ATPase [Algibacillus agarilyticus]